MFLLFVLIHVLVHAVLVVLFVVRIFSGGGTFVSKSGKVQHFSEGNAGARGGGARAAIPEEALPSEETLNRQLEAITISDSELNIEMLIFGGRGDGGRGDGGVELATRWTAILFLGGGSQAGWKVQ